MLTDSLVTSFKWKSQIWGSVLKAVDVVEDPAEWDQDQQKGWQEHTLANYGLQGSGDLNIWYAFHNEFPYEIYQKPPQKKNAPVGAKGRVFPEALATGSFS